MRPPSLSPSQQDAYGDICHPALFDIVNTWTLNVADTLLSRIRLTRVNKC